MNKVYRYFRIWALMVLSTQVVVGMDADMAGEVLFNAVRLNNIDNVRAALDAGANVNWRNHDGCTALMYALSVEIVNALIAAGADVNAVNLRGDTALIQAVMFHRRIEKVNALIAAGADVNVQNLHGDTALMRAVMFDRPIEIVNALIAAGVDVNVQQQGGATALMDAVRGNRPIEVVNALIAAGADVNLRDLRGNTALTTAKENINTLINLLQALCDNNKLYDQLYAISEDEDAVIAQVESIMQQVQGQVPESERKQTILESLAGFVNSFYFVLK